MSPPACEVLAVTNAKPARGSRGASDAPHVPEPTEATVPAQEGRDRPTSWKEGARRTLEVNPASRHGPVAGRPVSCALQRGRRGTRLGSSALSSPGPRPPARAAAAITRLASRYPRPGDSEPACGVPRVAAQAPEHGALCAGHPCEGLLGTKPRTANEGRVREPRAAEGPGRRRQPLPPRPSALRAKYLRRAAPGSSSRRFREGLRASVTDRTTRIPAAQTLGQRRTRAKRGPWTCARRGRAGRAARAHLAAPPALCPRPRALRNQGSPRPRPHR